VPIGSGASGLGNGAGAGVAGSSPACAESAPGSRSAIHASGGSVRYEDLPGGSGQAEIAAGEDASRVVVNTPATLYLYDPFSIGGDVARGLDYQVQLTGATPANWHGPAACRRATRVEHRGWARRTREAPRVRSSPVC
jgi:hypothetical protein